MGCHLGAESPANADTQGQFEQRVEQQSVTVLTDGPLLSLTERGVFVPSGRRVYELLEENELDYHYFAPFHAYTVAGHAGIRLIVASETGDFGYVAASQARNQGASSQAILERRTIAKACPLFGISREHRAEPLRQLASGTMLSSLDRLSNFAVVHDGTALCVVSRHCVYEPLRPKIGDTIEYTNASGALRRMVFQPPQLAFQNAAGQTKYAPNWVAEYRDWIETLKDLIDLGVIAPDTLIIEPVPMARPQWCPPDDLARSAEYAINPQGDSSRSNVFHDDSALLEQAQQRRQRILNEMQEMLASVIWDYQIQGTTRMWVSRVRVKGSIYDNSVFGRNLTCEVLKEFVACPLSIPSQQFVSLKGSWTNDYFEAKYRQNYPAESQVESDAMLVPLRPFRCEDGLSGRTPYRLHWIE